MRSPRQLHISRGSVQKMANIPPDLKYTEEHEWLRISDETSEVGVTDFAQESLGDVTYIEFPTIGDVFNKSETFGVIESVKAASDLYMPVGGEIVEINEEADTKPELVNEQPYSTWIVRIRMTDPTEVGSLLTDKAYRELTGEQS